MNKKYYCEFEVWGKVKTQTVEAENTEDAIDALLEQWGDSVAIIGGPNEVSHE